MYVVDIVQAALLYLLWSFQFGWVCVLIRTTELIFGLRLSATGNRCCHHCFPIWLMSLWATPDLFAGKYVPESAPDCPLTHSLAHSLVVAVFNDTVAAAAHPNMNLISQTVGIQFTEVKLWKILRVLRAYIAYTLGAGETLPCIQAPHLNTFVFDWGLHYPLFTCMLAFWCVTSHISCHIFVCLHSISLLFFFNVFYVSFPVVLFITGEAPSAALPAHAGWAALPVQAFLHREHFWWWPQKSHTHAATLPQPQVQGACVWLL